MKLLKCLVVLMFTLALSFPTTQAQQMSAEQLVEKLDNALKTYERVRTVSETLSMYNLPFYGAKPQWRKAIDEFRYDGERFDIIRHTWFELQSADEPTPPASAQNYRQMWDGERIFDHWFFDGEDTRNVRKDVVVSRERQILGDQVPYIDDAHLRGILGTDLRLVTEILRESDKLTLRDSTEAVGGSNCYVIEASGKYGRYTLWIDPEHGYNIARAQVHKSGGDIIHGKPMNRHTVEKIDRYAAASSTPVTAYDFELSDVRFEQVDGVWVPMEAEFRGAIVQGENDVVTYKTRHKRTLVDIDPDFEAIGAFVANLPDGTGIRVPEAPGIRYIWQNGAVVPTLDDFVPEMVDYVIEDEQLETKLDFAPESIKTEQADAQLDMRLEKATASAHPQPPLCFGKPFWPSFAAILTPLAAGLVGLALLRRSQLRQAKPRPRADAGEA